MPSEYSMREQIRKLEHLSSHEEKLYQMLEVYMKLFPMRNAYLFRYSPFGYLAEGIFLVTATGLVHIREMRDDVRSLPVIWAAIREKKAKYVSGIEYLKQTSCKYVIGSHISSVVVVPLFMGSVVIGYICSTEFNEGVDVDDKLLTSLTMFGKLSEKIIENSYMEDSNLLSNREFEVMRRISWGETTKEMADSMKISDLTVKQYVKTAIQKLGGQNRAHAVAQLFRKGILS
ncbi:LuxR C-terminal-related transcriptional regulator [Schinkia sp. CFF1]